MTDPRTDTRAESRHLVRAATILGLCLVAASGLFVWGQWFSLDCAAARLQTGLREHARSTERAGAEAGVPVRDAVLALTRATEKHAGSIERAGATIAQPTVRMESPIAVQQPVRIAGPMEDGTLPVAATIGK